MHIPIYRPIKYGLYIIYHILYMIYNICSTSDSFWRTYITRVHTEKYILIFLKWTDLLHKYTDIHEWVLSVILVAVQWIYRHPMGIWLSDDVISHWKATHFNLHIWLNLKIYNCGQAIQIIEFKNTGFSAITR